MWSYPISSIARAKRVTASGPSRYETLGNSIESFIAARSRSARDHERLPAHEVAVRAAEEVDRARGHLREAATAERDHLVHGGDPARLHADLHRAAGDVDRAALALGERLRQPRLDVAERHA